MGVYLIPGASFENMGQIISHVRQQGAWHEQMVWDHGVEGGVLFTDPTRTDADCAALYSGLVLDSNWVPPLPDPVRMHVQHLRDYLAADPTAITNAQTVHVVRDLIRAVFYLNRRLENE